MKRLGIDFLLALFIFLLVNRIFLGEFTVKGTSMIPTVFPGERIIVLKFPKPKIRRCDIIVFLYPRDPHKTFIKRVVGLPGEQISIRGDGFFVNGKRAKPCRSFYRRVKLRAKIPLGFFFVLGDNFKVSNDSRYGWLVPEEFVLGKAIAVYWPLFDLRRLK